MRMPRNLVLAVLLGVLVLPLASLLAQTTTPPPQTFTTTIYLDYRYYLGTAGPVTLKPTDATKAYLSNQFVFRRAYFTYENKINDNLKFRFRLDADNTANVTGVTLSGTPPTASTSKDDKLRSFIKHIYIEYSNFLVPKAVLTVGMIETLTFKPSEERWGYRSVAKTLMDGYKDITKKEIRATSADIGASLKYSFAKYFRVAAMVSNGAHYSHAENDQFKKLMLQAQVSPVAGFSIVGYYDYERQLLDLTSFPDETAPAAQTYKLDAFFEMVKNLVVGGEWFTYKHDLYQTAGEKSDVSGYSVFGRFTIRPDKLALFARYDSYVPNTLDDGLDMSLIIAGLDWAPYHASWKIQPNIRFYNYTDGTRYNANATKNSDIVFNMTFFLSF